MTPTPDQRSLALTVGAETSGSWEEKWAWTQTQTQAWHFCSCLSLRIGKGWGYGFQAVRAGQKAAGEPAGGELGRKEESTSWEAPALEPEGFSFSHPEKEPAVHWGARTGETEGTRGSTKAKEPHEGAATWRDATGEWHGFDHEPRHHGWGQTLKPAAILRQPQSGESTEEHEPPEGGER